MIEYAIKSFKKLKYMLKKVALYTLLFLYVSSCASKEPYEIKSPCVSINSDNPFAHNPCIRKPINLDII